MAEGDEKKSTIIIVKKKGGHGGAHGGAWKVAYADFVTAMMAFFLLMWLLNSISQDQKEALSEYFKNFSLFDTGGSTHIEKIAVREKPGKTTDKAKEKAIGVVQLHPDSIEGQKNVPFVQYGKHMAKEFVDELQKIVNSKLADIKNQIRIDITEDGVRIQLVDRDGKDMFRAGSATPSRDCERALKVIAEAFKPIGNDIAIEGHTDALGQNDGPAGNWSLSTRRALAAREMLEESGVTADHFARVTGKADTEPLIRDDEYNSQNRRVAITLLFPKPDLPGGAGPPPLEEEEGGPSEEPEPPPGSEGAAPTQAPSGHGSAH